MSTTAIVRSEHRSLLAFVLALDPNARKAYSVLKRMNAEDLHPDYMYVRNATGAYDRVPDPGAWNGKIKTFGLFGSEARYIGVTVIRRGDEEWSIHEC